MYQYVFVGVSDILSVDPVTEPVLTVFVDSKVYVPPCVAEE
jgi:hypothetical protein